MDSAQTFSKNYSFWGIFFNKDYTFYTNNYEYNLRIFANFRVKTLKSTDFAYTFSKNYSFFFSLLKIILFTLKIYFLQRKTPKVL